MNLRVGIGTDAHRRVSGRRLILGGVEIASDFGLDAHSDGDVLAHAILDAMFGAMGLGDKGTHFPPSDSQYKDIRSTELLKRATETLRQARARLINVDVSVVCEEPKLTPFISRMKGELAACLGISESRISIKGTTTERLGFTGRKEGIAAMAVALVECDEDNS